MKLSDFDYPLPEALIAKLPLERRSASRLLVLGRQTGDISHQQFCDLVDLIQADDLLVFNNTKVIPARLFAKKKTGGRVEILIERLLAQDRVLAMVKGSKRLHIGDQLDFHGVAIEVIAKRDDFLELKFLSAQHALDLIERFGDMPLPPYIKRKASEIDRTRYQTVYAKAPGAVAAPTAGLHFDQALLDALTKKGIKQTHLTLHVGAGTFLPVRVDNITQHQMHAEYIEVSQAVCDLVAQTEKNGGRVIAVGTTSLRALESASLSGVCQPFYGDTDIFIYPGFEFQCIDALITNFHLPKSSLLMLVSALAGLENVKRAYQVAIAEKYRFFSYGDAMLII